MPLRSDNYTVLVPKAEVARRLQIGRTSVLRILPGSQALKRVAKDPIREDRIQNEAVVDAYGPEERAMGWYYYLASKISFPLQAKCIAFKRVSLLRKGETVKVLRLAPEDSCSIDMLVLIRWQGRKMAVPLSQLAAIDPDESTQEAISDWHYWVSRRYLF